MTEDGFRRKLTAILSADVEGYSMFSDTGMAISYGQLGLEEESRSAAAEVFKLNPNFNIKKYLMNGSYFLG